MWYVHAAAAVSTLCVQIPSPSLPRLVRLLGYTVGVCSVAGSLCVVRVYLVSMSAASGDARVCVWVANSQRKPRNFVC